MHNYKKLTFMFLLLFSIELLLIAFFNYKVDSVGVFHKNTNELIKIADSIIKGKNIVGLSNYPEKELQKLIIKQNSEIPDAIVLGSSRSMLVRYEFIKNENITSYLNHSTSGAIISDFVEIIEEYKKKSNLPKNIFIGVDPWIFNRENASLEVEMLINNQSSSEHNANYKIFTKYRNLINYDFTLENIKYIKNYFIQGKQKYKIVDTIIDLEENSFVLDKYSTHYYPKITNEKLNLLIESEKKQIVKDNTYYELMGFHKLSNQETFEKFIAYLQNNGSNVTLFMLPYSPETYPLLMKHEVFKNIQKVEEYIYSFSKQKGLTCIGTYNPEGYDFIKNDFRDGMHGNAIVAKKVFKGLK